MDSDSDTVSTHQGKIVRRMVQTECYHGSPRDARDAMAFNMPPKTLPCSG